MIKTVSVVNPSGEELALNLRSSGDNPGLYIFDFDGLGSPKGTVNATGGLAVHGKFVNSVSVDARHLILTLATTKVGDDEEAVRAMVYKYFPVTKQILLSITTDASEYKIPAIVESNDVKVFAKIVNFTISLYCPKPYFEEVGGIDLIVATDEHIPRFEFPFSNESLTKALLIIGEIGTNLTTIHYYDGVETGCDIEVYYEDVATGLILLNSNGGQMMSISDDKLASAIGGAIQAEDIIKINTRVGQKSIKHVRGTVETNIINAVGLFDDWIVIKPGWNIFELRASTGSGNVEVLIEFTALKEGI